MPTHIEQKISEKYSIFLSEKKERNFFALPHGKFNQNQIMNKYSASRKTMQVMFGGTYWGPLLCHRKNLMVYRKATCVISLYSIFDATLSFDAIYVL